MENGIQVFVAMMGETAIVLPAHMTRLIGRLGATPAEQVVPRMVDRRHKSNIVNSAPSQGMHYGMFDRDDDRRRARRSWKTYRGRQWRRVVAAAA